MDTKQIGEKLVELCRVGKNMEAIDSLYSKDIVSIEAMSMPEMPREMRGIDQIREKNKWWVENNEVHGVSVEGPFPNEDRFIVKYNLDITAKVGPMAGKRMKMDEVGLYTVKEGKVVREEFFYET
ncbi:MAG TPA: nuclear transport factor 2 family protein [Thermoanaerobaculia bacterium]|nr:nuclear transport factor 2 family protein [Thermoanaerobaculia bacterium]